MTVNSLDIKNIYPSKQLQRQWAREAYLLPGKADYFRRRIALWCAQVAALETLAALHAAVEQVVPASQSTDRRPGPLEPGDRLWDDETASLIRRDLLYIITELENAS